MIKNIDKLSLDEINKYNQWMVEALNEAKKCSDSDDVPVGAIVVLNDKIIGRGYNMREKFNSPIWHAEIVACNEAAKNLGCWNLSGTLLIVTKEPCVMCSGLLVQARISTCIFSIKDEKGGGCGGALQIANNEKLNHKVNLICGIMENECLNLIQDFFKLKRKNK